jgi:hypothetical protein
MSTLTQVPAVDGGREPFCASSTLVTVRLLRAIARFVDSHGWLVFATVSAVCGWLRLNTLASRPLDHDELYSFYIAQAPSLKQLLELTRTVDLHPPLSYILIRASFRIFGIGSWSCRLPCVLAFLLTTALLFWLARRILSPLYAIVSLLFLWSVPFTYRAGEARPYSLLLCFTALMLASWHRAIEPSSSTAGNRRFALLSLTSGGFGLLLSHVLGVLPYSAFFAAELVRFRLRRKPDWSLWLALLLPAISGLTYLPLLRTRAAIVFTDQYRVTPMRIVNCYWEAIRLLTIPLMFAVLLALLWPLVQRRNSQYGERANLPTSQTAISAPLAFVLACFSLVPVGIGTVFARTGTAFFDRYGIVILIPLALVPSLLVGFRTQRNQMAGVALALVLAAVFFFNTSGRVWLIEQLGNYAPPKAAKLLLNLLALPQLIYEPVQPRVPPRLQKALEAAPPVSDLATVEPDLPLVANTGLTFLEVDRQGDAKLANRLYLLDDRQAAASIAHDTVFENYDRLTRVFPIRGKVEPYCTFISAHPRFLVLGAYNHPQGWLLKKLDMDGADLRIIGTYVGITEEAQFYKVTVAKAGCPAGP